MNKKELWRKLDAAIDNPNKMMAAIVARNDSGKYKKYLGGLSDIKRKKGEACLCVTQ